MLIVAGHITVDPAARESYLADCTAVVEQGRTAAGCLDFSISADLVDPSRINILERWESQEAVDAFRSRVRATIRAPRSDRPRCPSTTSRTRGHCSVDRASLGCAQVCGTMV